MAVSTANQHDEEAVRGLDELEAPAPDRIATELQEYPHDSLESRTRSKAMCNGDSQPLVPNDPQLGGPDQAPTRRIGRDLDDTGADEEYGRDEEMAENLDEVAAPAPDENVDETRIFRHESLESERRREESREIYKRPTEKRDMALLLRSELKITSYLIFFSIFGVLARLGLVALTAYPGAPNANSVLWANVAGSLIMGFLREDRLLFGSYYARELEKAQQGRVSAERESSEDSSTTIQEHKQAVKTAYETRKSTLHIFIGLTVGFCGSFTSFADIIRNGFFAIANDFKTASTSSLETTSISRHRNDGYSILAVMAIVWLEVAMSLGGLHLGAHLAEALHGCSKYLPAFESDDSSYVDYFAVFLGWGLWIGAIMLVIWSPHSAWRGQVGFALIFAPPGCILRYYLAIHLNRRLASFPLGTFAANVLGTCALGMISDFQYSQLGGVVGCQVLQGVSDGFCGALTTVSTWVLELKTLRRVHSYIYGGASIAISLAFMVVIMGSVFWTKGFLPLSCKV